MFVLKFKISSFIWEFFQTVETTGFIAKIVLCSTFAFLEQRLHLHNRALYTFEFFRGH